MKKFTSSLLLLVLLFSSFTNVNAGMMPGQSADYDPKYFRYMEVGALVNGYAYFNNWEDAEITYGFIDYNGREIVSNIYNDVMNFSEGYAGVLKNGLWGFIDTNGVEIIAPIYDQVYSFSEGLAGVNKNGKWGFINPTGEIVIPFEYGGILNFNDGLAPALKEDFLFYLDTTGNKVIQLSNADGYPYMEARIGIKQDNKWGFLDSSGQTIVPIEYDLVYPFINNYAAFLKDTKWGFMDKDGTVIINNQYDQVIPFYEEKAAVMKDGLWGFIDPQGNEVINLEYEEVLVFKEGLAAVRKNGLWGFIDHSGEKVVQNKYTQVHHNFSDGLALVTKQSIYGNMQGYIDQNGNEYYFDYDFFGTPFENGLAVVSDAGQGTYHIIESPLLKKDPIPATPLFIDLPIDYHALDQIYFLVEKGVVQGFTDDTFRPNQLVTRGQFATMLARALNLPAADSNFSDLHKGQALYDGVSRAAKAGIVQGRPDGKFLPNQEVTRADMAVMIDRALQIKGAFINETELLPYEDANRLPRYANTSIKRMHYYGIIDAFENNKFSAEVYGTREDTSIFIYRMLQLIEENN